MLYLVPTPIGNLGDMTFRAVEVLKEVDLILAEDTRTSSTLLKHYEIDTPMQAFHMHNEHRMVAKLVEEFQSGKTMALITDAGSPGISDPGFLLVRACAEAEIDVSSLPGATALIPALAASGLPSDRFTFEGFLPHKKGRMKRLGQLENETRTMVFYESPHRILKTLDQMAEIFGKDRKAVLAREVSKKFETFHRGTIEDILALGEKAARGELVLIISGKE